MLKITKTIGMMFFLIFIMVICQTAIAEQKSSLALDLVILLDETHSMQRENSPNDRSGYRHDAAAALMGLCDVVHSRVAIVPFTNEDEYADDAKILNGISGLNKLLPVDVPANQRNRERFIELLLNENKNDKTANLYSFCMQAGNGTDLGSALKKAVDLLLKSNDIGNKRVIVFLSDGKTDSNSAGKSEAMFQDACDRAEQNGIPIYTIGLNLGKNEFELLERAAEQTNGKCRQIDSAKEIPEVFNTFFMDMVGSEIVKITGKPVISGDTTQTTITIPNKSIAEANILVPTGKGSRVELYKPNESRSVRFNTGNYYQYQTTYFTLIKIIKPDIVGEWTLKYSFRNNAPDELRNVAANVIFSYDVYPSLNVSESVLKTDKNIPIEVKFYSSNGEIANDPNLYISSLGAEYQIKGKLDITVEKGNESQTKTFDLKIEKDKYTYFLSIPNLYKELGWSPLSTDKILLRGYFKGAGIDKSTDIKNISIQNQVPIVNQDSINEQVKNWQNISIHDPFRLDFMQEMERTIDLNACVDDPDGEAITFENYTLNSDVFKMVSLENGILKVSTNNKTGSAEFSIVANDEDGGKTTIAFIGNVTIEIERIAEAYHAEIKMSTLSPQTNEPVQVTVSLFDDNNTLIVGNAKLDNFDVSKLQISVKLKKDGTTQTIPLDFKQNENEDGYSASFTTLPNAGFYKVEGFISIHGTDNNAPARETNLKNIIFPNPAETVNTAPKLKAGANKPNFDVIIHNPLAQDDEQYQAEWNQIEDISALVEDFDQEELSYAYVLVNAENDGIIANIDPNGRLTMSSNDHSGKYLIRIIVSDPENEKYEFDIPVTITNIREILNQCTLKMVLPDVETELEKNTDYSIVLRLADQDGNIVEDKRLIDCLDTLDTSNIRLVFNAIKEEQVPLVWMIDKNAKGLQSSFTSSSNSGTYVLEGFATSRDDIQINVQKDTTWAVGNVPPWIVEEYKDGLQTSFEIEPLLWRNKNEKTYDINLNGYLEEGGLFRDTNSEKNLAYFAYDITGLTPKDCFESNEDEAETGDSVTEGQAEPSWEDVLKNGKMPVSPLVLILPEKAETEEEQDPAVHPYLLRLNNVKAGTHTFLLYAEDKDGERAIYTYEQTIVSQKAEVIYLGLMVLAGIGVLIALHQLIYWVLYRKSWKPTHGNAVVYVNNYSTGISRNFPRKGKGEIRLTDLRVTEASNPQMAAEIRKLTDCFRLRPGKNAVIIVRKKKKSKSGVTVYVGAVNMQNQKKANWPAGASIKFVGTGELTGNNVEVKREAAVQQFNTNAGRSTSARPSPSL